MDTDVKSGSEPKSWVIPNSGWRLWVGSLAVAWLVPAVTHALRVDIMVLPLIVVGVASLLRVGSSLVDRLVAASAVTAGLAMVAGLVFSGWPWGLSPFPVAGTSLTAMVLVSAVTGRRPQLPRKMRDSDVLVAGSGLAGTLVAAWPSLRDGPGGWLAYALLTDDRMRHVNLFDTIQQVGGYVFMNRDQAAPMVDPGMAKAYPCGMHFLYALVDSFVRSTASPDNAGQSGLSWFDKGSVRLRQSNNCLWSSAPSPI